MKRCLCHIDFLMKQVHRRQHRPAVASLLCLIGMQTTLGFLLQRKPASTLCLSDQSARDLLYQDQQKAMESRSKYEEELLRDNTSFLETPKFKKKPKSGGMGFGGGSKSKASRDTKAQADMLRLDGVIRIDSVMTEDTADRLLQYVLDQQKWAEINADASTARSFYGVEQARKSRCDLQLSLLNGGYSRDDGNDVQESRDHVLADALQEVLGSRGTLRGLYEELVTLEGEFYELAAVVTKKGSVRQIIHPDLPFRDDPPLYVVFLALQDVTADMGPTSFLIGTHRKEETDRFLDPSQKDEVISSSDCRLSLLKKGDAVVFDARILHCGNANVGNPRALFNFSFRNPKVTGDLGYDGSMRPGYCQQMNLKDVADALLLYEKGDTDPFARYGTGLL